jgi:hypothetical protein
MADGGWQTRERLNRHLPSAICHQRAALQSAICHLLFRFADSKNRFFTGTHSVQ